jgi:hypothetical protein
MVGAGLNPGAVTGDGRQASAEPEMSWRDETHPDPDADLQVKFHKLAGSVPTEQGVRAVEQAIDLAEDWASVAELTGFLRHHCLAGRQIHLCHNASMPCSRRWCVWPVQGEMTPNRAAPLA